MIIAITTITIIIIMTIIIITFIILILVLIFAKNICKYKNYNLSTSSI